jgi:hypothetical protein
MCSWFSELAVACGSDDDDFGGDGYGRGQDLFSLTWYLGWVALAMRAYGWVSRTAARDSYDRTATANEAWSLDSQSSGRGMTASESERLQREFKRKHGFPMCPSDADRELAAAAVAWALTLADRTDLSDYEHNLLVLAKSDIVNHRVDGLAASMIRRTSGPSESSGRRKEGAPRLNQHFGEVGKRMEVTVRVQRVIVTGGGAYGPSYLHIFDVDGMTAKWFASDDSGMVEDDVYRVKATVKKHDQYQGTLQTMLTRVTVLEQL